MRFFKKLVDKKLNFKNYIFKQQNVKIETKIEKPKIDTREKFDIYKYFLLPIEERNNVKW
jgi:hypothetical protein